MTKISREEWIGQVMDSTHNMSRATPPYNLFGKIERAIEYGTKTVKKVPLQTILATAASIAFLVVLNIYSLNTDSKASATQDNINTIVEYYGLNNNETLY